MKALLITQRQAIHITKASGSWKQPSKWQNRKGDMCIMYLPFVDGTSVSPESLTCESLSPDAMSSCSLSPDSLSCESLFSGVVLAVVAVGNIGGTTFGDVVGSSGRKKIGIHTCYKISRNAILITKNAILVTK